MDRWKRIWNMPYSFLDRQDKEERLTFNVLVGRHLRDITAALGVLQLVFAALSFIDRLNPTVASAVYYVEILANDNFWAGTYLLSGTLVLLSLKKMELRSAAMAISSACFGIWGVIIFFKAYTAVTPVALSLGVSVFAIGVVAYKVCLAWNVIMFNHKQFTAADVAVAKSETLDL